jgi:O-antigen/teichoic acid export membrane protein
MIRAILKSQGLRHAFALGTGTAIGQGIVLIASPLWSRLYAPADFGRYGLILSFLSMATVAVGLRYDIAIPLARDQNEAAQLTLLTLICTIPVSIAAGGIFVLLIVRDLAGFGAIAPWSTIFVVLSLVLTGTFSALRYFHVRSSNFRGIGASLIAQGFGRALTPIFLSPLKWGWVGLLMGEIIGRSLGIRSLAKPILPLVRSVAERTTPVKLRGLFRAYRRYPLVFLPSSILDAASGTLPVPIIVSLFGLSSGGEFLLAQQILSAPAGLISGSLGDVFHAQLVPGARGPTDLAKLVWRTAFRLLLVASLVYVPVACIAPFVAVPIFGAPWSRVGAIVAILCPATIIMVAVSPVARAMLVSRIPQIKLVADIIKLSLPALGLIAGFRLGGASLTKSVAWYSFMVSVSYVAYFAIVLFSIRVSNQLPSVRAGGIGGPLEEKENSL